MYRLKRSSTTVHSPERHASNFLDELKPCSQRRLIHTSLLPSATMIIPQKFQAQSIGRTATAIILHSGVCSRAICCLRPVSRRDYCDHSNYLLRHRCSSSLSVRVANNALNVNVSHPDSSRKLLKPKTDTVALFLFGISLAIRAF